MKINLDNSGNNAPRVEVVPLVDVIFCILTVFLLSGLQTARQQAINVDIPQAKTAEAQTRQMLIVSLDAEGRVFVEQQQFPQIQALSEAARNYRSTNPNGSIVLYASKQVRYERVMEILDLLRLAAGENVALATTSSPATASPLPTVPTFSPSASPLSIPAPSSTPSTSPSPSVLPLPTFSSGPRR